MEERKKVIRRLKPCKTRIDDSHRMRALFELHNQVFSPCQESFHWDLLSSIECAMRAVVCDDIDGSNSDGKNIQRVKQTFYMQERTQRK